MMISKNRIKEISSLSQKKYRDEQGLFVVEGEKMIEEALHSDFEVVEIWRQDEIGREAMGRISQLSSPSPVLALVRQKPQKSAPERPDDLMLALDSVRDPGNLGTIIRIADWFGISTVLASRDTVDVYNPKVVQATMGAVFRVDVIYCDLPQALRSYAEFGIDVYGTFLDGSSIYDARLSDKGIIVMGSESFGISPQVEETVSSRLLIPQFPAGAQRSESLNVAVATAITVAEFRRTNITTLQI